MKSSTKSDPATKRQTEPTPMDRSAGGQKNAQIATLEGLARLIVEEAAIQGATDCEVRLGTSQSVDITVRLGVVEQLEGAQSRGVTFNAYIGQKSATTSSSDLSKPALRKMVKDTIALAQASEADPYAGLPEAHQLAQSIPDLDLYDPAIAAIKIEEKIKLAFDTEDAALKSDPRITNSNGASFSDGGGITVYANSRGFLGSYQGNYCSLQVSVVASEKDEMQVNYWGHSSRSLKSLESPESIGKKAAERALSHLGARKVKSQVVPVVFDPQMSARLIAQFVGAAQGRSIDRKSSFLLDKLGQVVASTHVTIVDDPLMPGRIGSRPFDGEGLPLKRRNIVEQGKLMTYLVDAYAGRKLNCEPNSSATGNLHLLPGPQSPEQIIASVKNGLYLTGVSGPGFNAVTGDYSLGASGLWIENGKLSHPVSAITIAGNILEMFSGISAVGNDLQFRAGTNAPTILINKMTVAGD